MRSVESGFLGCCNPGKGAGGRSILVLIALPFLEALSVGLKLVRYFFDGQISSNLHRRCDYVRGQ